MNANTKKPLDWSLIAQSQAPHFSGNGSFSPQASIAHLNHRMDRLERQLKAFAVKVTDILDGIHQTEKGD